jgi:hypothetical protein
MPAVTSKRRANFVTVKQLTVTLPPDAIQRVKQVAEIEDRSFSNALAQLVRRATANLSMEEPATSW